MTIGLPVLLAIVGTSVYLRARDPRIAELGRLVFFAALLAMVLALNDPPRAPDVSGRP